MINENILKTIPDSPGVYLFKDKKGNVLYVGKAKNLKKRIHQYFIPGSLWKQEMLLHAVTIDFFTVKNESEALYLEDNLIKQYVPEYNNMLKGSNSYAYIKITNEDFPEIFLTRKKIQDGSLYIWPKHNTKELKNLFQYIRQILKYRSCKKQQFSTWKVCSDYYFWLCAWRCQKNIKTNNQKKVEYKQIIKLITSLFKWDTGPIQKEIKRQLQESVTHEHFERAAKLRDIYFHIQQLTEQQTVVLSKPHTWYILEVRKIGDMFVYVFLNLFQWKIIDIIRYKQTMVDVDEDQILSYFKTEVGDFITEKNTTTMFWYTKQMKLSQKDKKNIEQLIDWFFESYCMATSFDADNVNNILLDDIQRKYQLKQFPYHMEAIDISHLSWWWISGWLSCMKWWLPYPKWYRKYKIQTKNDDYASLKEVLLRRIKNTEDLPNMLLIDGGKGQLNIIKKILLESKEYGEIIKKMDIISLGKGKARKRSNKQDVQEIVYYFDAKWLIKGVSLVYDQSDRILTKLRDQAHKFANRYRKEQMKAEFISQKGKK